MKLITGVMVDHFRSIRNQEIGDLGHFTAIAGLNNSGKSNLLRALYVFFRNATKRNGKKAIPRDADYDSFKATAKKVVDTGISIDDLVHVKDFLRELLVSLEPRIGSGE